MSEQRVVAAGLIILEIMKNYVDYCPAGLRGWLMLLINNGRDHKQRGTLFQLALSGWIGSCQRGMNVSYKPSQWLNINITTESLLISVVLKRTFKRFLVFANQLSSMFFTQFEQHSYSMLCFLSQFT